MSPPQGCAADLLYDTGFPGEPLRAGHLRRTRGAPRVLAGLLGSPRGLDDARVGVDAVGEGEEPRPRQQLDLVDAVDRREIRAQVLQVAGRPPDLPEPPGQFPSASPSLSAGPNARSL